MKSFVVISALAATAAAQSGAWAQCGGSGFSGSTSCISGYTCQYSSEWYSQCVPGSGGGSGGTTTKAASTTKTSSKSSTKTSTTKTTTGGSSGGGSATTKIPASAGSTTLPSARVISGSFDGGMVKYDRSPAVCQGQTETAEAAAMFILEAGASIKNVIIGPGQAEGIHCRGTCTIENVWWTDVCEDAATFKQTSGTSYVIGGGAFSATDKIFQFNGRGTVSISNFYANNFGKLIRNCGDCTNNGGPRNVVISGVTAVSGGPLCGINTNYGDTCKISNTCSSSGKTCDLYKGVEKGSGSSSKISSGVDGNYCQASGLSTSC